MRYVRPEYYDRFRCLADKCPDTCCAGWQIMIDDASLEKYGSMENPAGRRLAGSIDWKEGCFLQEEGRCMLLNEQNLCDLVLGEGEDALCETCHRYPRHVEEFEGVREMSLSLSCPAAAEMILTAERPEAFLIQEDGESDPLEEEFEDFDLLLFTYLEDARAEFFKILQDRRIPFSERVKIILSGALEMQDCADKKRLFEMEDVIRTFARTGAEAAGRFRPAEAAAECGFVRGEARGEAGEQRRYEKLRRGFVIFSRLEHLRDEWPEVLRQTRETLYCKDYESYGTIRQAFLTAFHPDAGEYSWWETFQENLFLFFLYTYFCGAVYDEWIYSKAALAAFSVCYVEELVMSFWFLSGKRITKEKCVELAYRYAREIEHSDDNLNLLEEWLQQSRKRGE